MDGPQRAQKANKYNMEGKKLKETRQVNGERWDNKIQNNVRFEGDRRVRLRMIVRISRSSSDKEEC